MQIEESTQQPRFLVRILPTAFRQLTDFRAVTSVRNNVAANLVSKIAGLLITLACVPIYIRILGIGGYGLIGIWATIETLANLLDLGLSPTMTREMALLSAPGGEEQQARDLVRTLEVIYWGLALLIGGTVVAVAPVIATHWIKSSEISSTQTRTAISMIGVLIAARWPLSFYNGGLVGLERQVVLAWATTGIKVVTNFGAVGVLVWLSPTVIAFFIWQIAANSIHTVLMTYLLWKCMPPGGAPQINFGRLRGIRGFAAGTTGIAILSMVLSDLDKIVVSKRCSLEIFGCYTLAWRIAGIVGIGSGAVSIALLPALCRLVKGDPKRLADFYHRSCQLMSILVLPTATVMVLFGRQVIFAWTGSTVLAAKVYPIAALLTAGTALNCFAAVPYALQLANGWTALALYSNLASIFISVPLLLLFTSRYGATGAAAVWLLVNFSYLFTQIPFTHQRLLRGDQWHWYLFDVGLPFITCLVLGLLAFILTPVFADRFLNFLWVAIAFAALTIAATIATPRLRERLAVHIHRRMRLRTTNEC